uniref:Uncharacterized protein n=1 Tax=Cacopsylla melanoneura TaxID=428564 RepID=A0A8D8ZQV6_9HEMI
MWSGTIFRVWRTSTRPIWMAAIPTNELKMLSNIFGLFSVMIRLTSTPFGLSTLWHFSMAAANAGILIRSAPMPVHWDPIPENTNQMGRVSPEKWVMLRTRLFGFLDRMVYPL